MSTVTPLNSVSNDPSSSSLRKTRPARTRRQSSSHLSRLQSSASLFPLLLVFAVTLLSCVTPSQAIKFELPAHSYPFSKCIWNTAHKNALIIVTANVGPGSGQRVDIEVRDRDIEGSAGNIYLSKKNIKGETRLAVTAHSEGDVGVCFKNTLDDCTWSCSLVSISVVLC